MQKSKRVLLFISLVVFSVTSLSLPSQAAMSSSGKPCTITGSSKAETLRGTKGIDVICGFGGNDKIFGLAGNDILDGGAGADFLSGGSGKDSILGGNGKDQLNGGTGNDNLVGGPAVDASLGGGGLDTCEIGEGEARDVSCSLISNLSYLFETVTGHIESEINFDGCAIMLFRRGGGGKVAGGLIYGGGQFRFHAQDDLYAIQIGVPDGASGVNHRCQVESATGVQLGIAGVYVSGPEVYLEIQTPALEQVKISVINSNGTPIAGAPVKLETKNSGECTLIVNQETACGYVSWVDIEKQVADIPTSKAYKTDSQGNVRFLAPTGTLFSAFSRVTIAGAVLQTDPVEFRVGDGSNPELRFARRYGD